MRLASKLLETGHALSLGDDAGFQPYSKIPRGGHGQGPLVLSDAFGAFRIPWSSDSSRYAPLHAGLLFRTRPSLLYPRSGPLLLRRSQLVGASWEAWATESLTMRGSLPGSLAASITLVAWATWTGWIGVISKIVLTPSRAGAKLSGSRKSPTMASTPLSLIV